METTAEKKQALEDLTPREIVNKLDTYIVGQQKAKNLWLLPLETELVA